MPTSARTAPRSLNASWVRDQISLFVQYGILLLACFVTLLPILVIFMGSFKTGAEFNNSGPFDLPRNLYLDNYITAFTKGRMALGFFNTLIQLLFSSIGTVMTGTMTAYVLHRFQFRGRSLVRLLFLWIALIPSITAQVATFQIVQRLGLYNTRAAGIVLSMGTDIIAIYIFLQYLDTIPRSLDESAIIDGAGFFRIYFRIILPLLQPATVTVLIIKCIGLYNDFYTPYLYMPKQTLRVISMTLFTFKGPYGAQWQIVCAGVVIAMIPTLVIFILMQKHIYNGLVKGAVKE
jgi:multiple sugar transport system permease protein